MSTKHIDLSDPKAVAAATDEQFEASRAASPWTSLQYKHARDRMNDEQFEASRAEEPWYSLRYKHACDRMTDEQFEKSLRKCATEDFSACPWVTQRRYKE